MNFRGTSAERLFEEWNSGEFWGGTPRIVEIRLRYSAVFADSLILAFVRFRDGVVGSGDAAPPKCDVVWGRCKHVSPVFAIWIVCGDCVV